ncbi:MAG TPA: phage repressor protein [Candidatus Limosilactobacillus merdigallinarum]|uniref:Phage repressor protein n=1 Tax=Candidatus Limosilactobacillus merdigallinarum TaxID=2838652 RepID=A0A9D1VIM0_9LACO|nr:phage repressor protein [Candidatus Limosilactobacillus merdigallinarum]
MELRVENWNGHDIRFIGDGDNWKAVGYDVATALGYREPRHAIQAHVDEKDRQLINLSSVLNQAGTVTDSSTVKRRTTLRGGSPVMLVISEFGIYSLVFSSHMDQAKQFQRWTYGVIRQLRLSAGLEGYQAFKMLDRRMQQQSMARLEAISDVDYIKANVIANKAVSNKYGLPKMIKKDEMTPAMLKDRPGILNDVVDLMNVKQRYGLDFPVSETIYNNLDKLSR